MKTGGITRLVQITCPVDWLFTEVSIANVKNDSYYSDENNTKLDLIQGKTVLEK